MSRAKPSIRVEFKGLTGEDIESLHDFLKAQEGVLEVHSRIFTMDAAYDPSAHPIAAKIVGFALVISTALGVKALDIAADWVKEWLKNRQTKKPDAEVTLLYGSDNQPVIKVKKQDLK